MPLSADFGRSDPSLVYGLSAYLRSDIPTADERAAIIRKMSEVAGALQQYGWRPPCAGKFKGEFRGGSRAICSATPCAIFTCCARCMR